MAAARDALNAMNRDMEPMPGDAAARVSSARQPDPRTGEVLLARSREEIVRLAARYSLVGIWKRLRLVDGFRGSAASATHREHRRQLAAAIAALADVASLERRGVTALEPLRAKLEAVADWAAMSAAGTAATPSFTSRGRRGPAQRLSTHFLPVAVDLRSDRWWTWERIASLVLESGADWTEPPCPLAVEQWRDRDLVSALKVAASRLKIYGPPGAV